jgi:membrane fusion protein, multidrug efflux system
MSKRMVLMLVVVIAFIAIIGGVKYSQIKKGMAMQGAFQPPPEAVTTTVARQENWDASLNAIGSVVAVNGVTVSADLPGVIESISFDSGKHVGKGEVLVRLDAKQERAQLAAATAQLDLAGVQLQRAIKMRAQDIVAQEMVDQLAAEQKQASARVGEIRATIERKTIRAPFSGIAGIREVNLGQYVAGGAAIVSLQALQPVYVQFNVPQQEVAALRNAREVRVTSDGFAGTAVGKVTAVDSLVDEATRNMRVQAIFENRDLKLRPGMYVQAQLARGTQAPVITLPTSAISYAPFGDSIFIVEQVTGPDGKSYRGVRQQFVKLGASRGDQVAVLTGVKPGEEVVTSGVFKLRPGAAVIVNNKVQPGNNPAPKPEDS